MNISPPNPLSYTGLVATPFINKTFDPTTANDEFNVPTIWINTATPTAWILVSKPLGVANWVEINASGSIFEIDTPDGNTVSPIGNVIELFNGTGMNITGSGNAITFNSVGGGFTWTDVTGTSQALVAGNAYQANNGGLITFTLPATANFGDRFIISGWGAGGWTIAQNGGQSITVGSSTSTIGVGGSVSSILPTDTIVLLCTVDNTNFKALDWQGSLTVV